MRTLSVSERSLYSMRSLILSQCRDLKIGVTREDLGSLTTVRARYVHYNHALYPDISHFGENG